MTLAATMQGAVTSFVYRRKDIKKPFPHAATDGNEGRRNESTQHFLTPKARKDQRSLLLYLLETGGKTNLRVSTVFLEPAPWNDLSSFSACGFLLCSNLNIHCALSLPAKYHFEKKKGCSRSHTSQVGVRGKIDLASQLSRSSRVSCGFFFFSTKINVIAAPNLLFNCTPRPRLHKVKSGGINSGVRLPTLKGMKKKKQMCQL